MIPEQDIWRTALLLIKRHGARAPAYAEGQAAELAEVGDARVVTWRRIAHCVSVLSLSAPAPGESLH